MLVGCHFLGSGTPYCCDRRLLERPGTVEVDVEGSETTRGWKGGTRGRPKPDPVKRGNQMNETGDGEGRTSDVDRSRQTERVLTVQVTV